jgi:hypothetical protein
MAIFAAPLGSLSPTQRPYDQPSARGRGERREVVLAAGTHTTQRSPLDLPSERDIVTDADPDGPWCRVSSKQTRLHRWL